MKKYGWHIAMVIIFLIFSLLQIIAKEHGMGAYSTFIGYLKLVPLFVFVKLIFTKK